MKQKEKEEEKLYILVPSFSVFEENDGHKLIQRNIVIKRNIKRCILEGPPCIFSKSKK